MDKACLRLTGRFFQNFETMTPNARLDSVLAKIEEERDINLEGFRSYPQCQTGSARLEL